VLAIPEWFICPQTVIHPGSNDLIATPPGVKPTTSRSQVQRPNRYTIPASVHVDKESVRTGRVSAAVLTSRFRFNVNLSTCTLMSYNFPNNKDKGDIPAWARLLGARALPGQAEAWRCGRDFAGGK